jgi:hypothetical protein
MISAGDLATGKLSASRKKRAGGSGFIPERKAQPSPMRQKAADASAHAYRSLISRRGILSAHEAIFLGRHMTMRGSEAGD